MEIKLYSHYKATNSTALPGVATASISCVLKDETDIMNPTFIVVRSSAAQHPWNNYISWEETSSLTRYYFIKNRRFLNNGRLALECEEDVLATYKSYILATNAFVLRCAVTPSVSGLNGMEYISDTVYPTKQFKSASKQSFQPLDDTGNGFYVIGMIQEVNDLTGRGTNYAFQRGAVSYYTCTQSELNTLIYRLLHSSDIVADYDPLSRIVSCVYIPISESGTSVNTWLFDEMLGGSEVAYLWSHTQISNIDYNGEMYVQIGTKTLANHPQDDALMRFLNFAPFAHYVLHAGPFGAIEIDRALCSNAVSAQITLYLYIDCATGLARLRIQSGSNIINISEAKIGVETQLAQVTSNSRADIMKMEYDRNEAYLSIASGMVSSAISGNVGGALVSGFSNAISANNSYALSSYLTSIPKVSTVSTNESIIHITQFWFLVCEFAEIVESANAKLGRPCYQYLTLSEVVGGYVQCTRTACNTYSNKEEADIIDYYMNSGFILN